MATIPTCIRCRKPLPHCDCERDFPDNVVTMEPLTPEEGEHVARIAEEISQIAFWQSHLTDLVKLVNGMADIAPEGSPLQGDLRCIAHMATRSLYFQESEEPRFERPSS